MSAAITIFFVYIALDFIWALYTQHLVAKNATTAGLLSAVIIVLSGGGTVAFNENPWLLIPAGAGAFCGTWIASCDWLRRLGRALKRGRPSGGRAAPPRSEQP